ncbi:hypothetical protein [Magnetospirillum gryphiswaldense]|uniref:Uncharacterized protein n=1 Tax=Magnetospirillum gryphiswaldense TaxID=55518 RepID=A4TZL9_9PROT|nr:hypothetical protein [Magnetospirillum gryphiswaldense]AVM73625.1 hypothetical protein MSR1_11270 [Magnetospirillum gryphiswaldense MSR-1]AVM77528.1 hypothetical protein MSR1L_11270 [Magnetospirillum gryphiswaldense]CAM76076.1 conserved hypothetical protein [Magnetospirillum gryphiswaldense MSR-1]
MSEIPFPSRRTSEAEQRDRTFLAILDAMLKENETITARAVARRLEGVDHASSITRDPWRNARLSEWQGRQADLRRMIERTDKNSKSNLAAALARKDVRIRELEERVALLTASHRAMIHAIGEMGGMRAWSRFFENYDAAQDELHRMGAMLKTDLLPVLPKPK